MSNVILSVISNVRFL